MLRMDEMFMAKEETEGLVFNGYVGIPVVIDVRKLHKATMLVFGIFDVSDDMLVKKRKLLEKHVGLFASKVREETDGRSTVNDCWDLVNGQRAVFTITFGNECVKEYLLNLFGITFFTINDSQGSDVLHEYWSSVVKKIDFKKYLSGNPRISRPSAIMFSGFIDGIHIPFAIYDKDNCSYSKYYFGSEKVRARTGNFLKYLSDSAEDMMRSVARCVLGYDDRSHICELMDQLCFDKNNDHSVTIRVRKKDSKTALLRFDGFNGMYDMFKIQLSDSGAAHTSVNTGSFTAYRCWKKNDNPHTVPLNDVVYSSCKYSDASAMFHLLMECVEAQGIMFYLG